MFAEAIADQLDSETLHKFLSINPIHPIFSCTTEETTFSTIRTIRKFNSLVYKLVIGDTITESFYDTDEVFYLSKYTNNTLTQVYFNGYQLNWFASGDIKTVVTPSTNVVFYDPKEVPNTSGKVYKYISITANSSTVKCYSLTSQHMYTVNTNKYGNHHGYCNYTIGNEHIIAFYYNGVKLIDITFIQKAVIFLYKLFFFHRYF